MSHERYCCAHRDGMKFLVRALDVIELHFSEIATKIPDVDFSDVHTQAREKLIVTWIIKNLNNEHTQEQMKCSCFLQNIEFFKEIFPIFIKNFNFTNSDIILTQYKKYILKAFNCLNIEDFKDDFRIALKAEEDKNSASSLILKFFNKYS